MASVEAKMLRGNLLVAPALFRTGCRPFRCRVQCTVSGGCYILGEEISIKDASKRSFNLV